MLRDIKWLVEENNSLKNARSTDDFRETSILDFFFKLLLEEQYAKFAKKC